MKRKLFSTVLILVTTGLLFLTACGGSTPPEPVSITIEMDEFSYMVHKFNLMELRVGQEVTLTLVNNGLLEHEIMFGRNMESGGNGMPMGYEIDFFEYAGVEPLVTMPEIDHDDDPGEETHGDDHHDDDEGVETAHHDDGEDDQPDDEIPS